jgi:uncharacterized protein (DUF302 family)
MKKQYVLISILFFSFNGMLFTQEANELYFSKTIEKTFEETTQLVKIAFSEQGLGVITEIEMHDKLQKKFPDMHFKPYRILGVCDPSVAVKLLKEEENIGIILPCKIVIKQIEKSKTEVVVVNPSAMIQALGNDNLSEIATELTSKFKTTLEEL